MTTRQELRAVVRGAYDLQKLRIETGNRIVANWRASHGQEPGEKEDTLDVADQNVLNVLRANYTLLTEGLVNMPRAKSFKGNEIISTYAELSFIGRYVELLETERKSFVSLGHILDDFPIYTEFLSPIRGVGPAMAGVLISEIDIAKATYPSSLWMYSGLDVAPDGKGRSRRKEHLIEREYIDKEGNVQKKKSITYNPWLKTKLFVLATSFVKQPAEKCVYRSIYDGYKNRLENHPAHVEKTKAHRHNMAMRYMLKRFLVDLHIAWRTIEGLPVSEEYAVAKLGIVHSR